MKYRREGVVKKEWVHHGNAGNQRKGPGYVLQTTYRSGDERKPLTAGKSRRFRTRSSPTQLKPYW